MVCAVFVLKYLILILFGLSPAVFNAQSEIFTHISTEKGLSQSEVRCLLQDRNGFLWIGTQDGLNRFDGYNFVVYKNDPFDSLTISNNLITSLLEDRWGFLWVGTVDGLNKMDPINGLFYRIPNRTDNTEGIIGQAVMSLEEDSEGNIWAGTYLGGLNRIEPENFSTKNFRHSLTEPNSLSDNSIIQLFFQNSKTLWIGTFGNGLDKYDTESGVFTHFPPGPETFPSGYIMGISSVRKGQLLIATNFGLYEYSDTTQRFSKIVLNKTFTPFQGRIKTLLVDDNKTIWIGTEDAGLFRKKYHENFFHNFSNSPFNTSSLSENDIVSLTMDSGNCLWIGTHAKGLDKLSASTKKFHHIKGTDLPGSLVIRSVFEDTNGALYLGTDDGLFSENRPNYDKNTFSFELISPGEGVKFWHSVKDKAGTLWCASQEGIFYKISGSNTFVHLRNNPSDPASLPYNVIRYIYPDDSGLIWFGTFGQGLFSYNPVKKEYRQYNHSVTNPESISDDIVFYIMKDSKQNFWICTSRGLNLFKENEGSFVKYFHDPKDRGSLPSNIIYSISEFKDGYLISTHGGLAFFSPESGVIYSVTENEGLQNNVVYSAIADDSGNIWVSTNAGISKINSVDRRIINYNKSDGLPVAEFNAGSAARLLNGYFIFGGIGGVVYFRPDEIIPRNFSPNCIITRFYTNNRLTKFEYLKDNTILDLEYTQNTVSFEYAAFDYADPGKIIYNWEFIGLKNPAKYEGRLRYASFTDLDPGSYKFVLTSTNSDGIRSAKSLILQLNILPPFWLTWWFKLILIILLVIILSYLIVIKRSQIKNELESKKNILKQILASQETERSRIASELHDSVGQNLIIIKNLAQLANVSAEESPFTKKFNEISEITSGVLDEVRQISYNLRPYQLSQLGLSRTLRSLINKTRLVFQGEIISDIGNIDGHVSFENEIHFFRILQELLSNTLKHSGATRIEIELNIKSNELEFSFFDNGCGFNPADSELKSGLGMIDLNERILILGGKLELSSQPGQGVKYRIIIPYSKRDSRESD